MLGEELNAELWCGQGTVQKSMVPELGSESCRVSLRKGGKTLARRGWRRFCDWKELYWILKVCPLYGTPTPSYPVERVDRKECRFMLLVCKIK